MSMRKKTSITHILSTKDKHYFTTNNFSYHKGIDLLLSLNTPTPLFLFIQGSGNVFRHFSCLLRYIFSETYCAGYPPVAPPASFALLLCGLL